MKSPIKNQIVHKCNLPMDRHVCVIITVAYRVDTDRHTDRQKIKAEGTSILSNAIFYFRTMIIGGNYNHNNYNLNCSHGYV